MMKRKHVAKLLGAMILCCLLMACQTGASGPDMPVATETLSPTPTAVPTATPGPPTPTPLPEPTETPTVVVETLENVPYVQNGEPQQVMDIYYVADVGVPQKAIFMLPLSYWSRYLIDWPVRELALSGYAVAVVYRRQPETNSYQAQLEDAHCAFAWLHENVDEYNLDPENIFVMGFGGQVAVAHRLAQTEDAAPYMADCDYPWPEAPRVRGIIAGAGIFDFTDMEDSPQGQALAMGMEGYFGASYEEAPDVWAAASPLLHIDGSLPPHLIIYPEDDEYVPKYMSENYAEALEQAGVDVTLVTVPDTDADSVLRDPTCSEAILEFVDGM